MRHDNLRDLNAKLLAKIQKDVETEPALIPIEEDNAVGNGADEARLDIRAKGFWRPAQDVYFDVRVTNHLSATSLKTSLIFMCF